MSRSVKQTRRVWGLFVAVLSVLWVGPGWALEVSEQLHISGYGNIHSMDHNGMPRIVGKDDPNDNVVQMREFSLFVDLDVTDGVVASFEQEIGANATRFTPNYAYVDFDIGTLAKGWDEDRFGGLSVRAGRILVPFLSYNENKPNFKQNLMSQPFTAWQMAPVVGSAPEFGGIGWSDVGAMINWNKEMGDLGLFDLKFSVINGLGSDSNVLDDNSVQLDAGMMQPIIRPRDGFIQNEQFDFRDNNAGKATVVKATYVSPLTPLDIGVSWYQGSWDPDSDKGLNMYGVHLNWLLRDYTLKGEWVTADVEQTAGTLLEGPGLNMSTGDYSMNAWYVEGSYIPLRWGDREDRFVRLVLRYDDVDTNDQAAFTPFDRGRITVGTEFQFVSNARLRYEFQYSDIDSFSSAPGPFSAAGGNEAITMNMFSMIFWF